MRGFVDQMRYRSFSMTTFSSDFHPFFAQYTSQFSLAIIGRLKHTSLCDYAIEGRRESEADSNLVTYTIYSNLKVEVFIDGEKVLEKPQQEEIKEQQNAGESLE